MTASNAICLFFAIYFLITAGMFLEEAKHDSTAKFIIAAIIGGLALAGAFA